MARAMNWERAKPKRETEAARPTGEERVPLRRPLSRRAWERMDPRWKDAIAKVYGRRG